MVLISKKCLHYTWGENMNKVSKGTMIMMGAGMMMGAGYYMGLPKQKKKELL